jgi:hypothetical protein
MTEIYAQRDDEGIGLIDELLEPYASAMLTASGLTREQAWTCVYYACATHHIEMFERFPILAFLGNAGTGKTVAQEQISKMVRETKRITGRTAATVRDELSNTTSALIDESDSILGLEELLNRRYSRQTGTQIVNRATPFGGYQPEPEDIFGATVVCRRRPFRDVAMRSRAIIIRTRARVGNYRVVEVDGLERAAKMIEPQQMDAYDRVMDTWKPLLVIAHAVDDGQWLDYANRQIESEARQLKANQGLEPNDALVFALRIHCRQQRVKLSVLRDTLRQEYDVRLTIGQILDLCQGLGISVVKPQGYLQAILEPEYIQGLLKEIEEASGEKTGDI